MLSYQHVVIATRPHCVYIAYLHVHVNSMDTQEEDTLLRSGKRNSEDLKVAELKYWWS